MKIQPEDSNCFMVHFVGIIVCILALVNVIEPSLMSVVWSNEFFRSWPEIWVGLPLLLLALNILYFFIERSVVGFLVVVLCCVLLVYQISTYSVILVLMGNQP
jgi:hypothetical protein